MSSSSSSPSVTATATTQDNQSKIYDAVDAKLNVEKKDGGLSFSQKSISAINDNIISWLRTEFPEDADFSSALSYLSMLVLSSTTSYDLYIALTRSTLLSQLVAGLPLAKSLSSFEHMIKTIVGLGSISMSGHDAKTLFSYITGKQAIIEGGSEGADKKDEALRRRVAVYRALIDIISDKEDKHEICRNFFTFAPTGGSAGTSIEIEPGTTFDAKWPSSYGVFLWANFDDLPVFHRGSNGAQAPYEPRLVSLTSGSEEGEGIEIFLSGPSNDLVVRLGASRVITASYAFEIGRWYNIVVTHSAGKDILFKSSEMCVYVNGQLVTRATVKVPSTSGTLARRSIGNGPKRAAQQSSPISPAQEKSQQQQQTSAMKRMSSFFHIGSSSSSSSSSSENSSSGYAGRHQSNEIVVKDTRPVDGAFKGKIASVTMTHSGTISHELIQTIYSYGPNFTLTSGYLKKIKGCGAVVDFSFTSKGMLEFGTCINVDCGTKGSALSNAFSTIGVGQSHSGASVSTLKGRLCPGVRAVSLRSPVDALFSAVGMGPVILLFHPETIAQFPRSVALPYAAELVDAMLRGSPVEAVREFRALDGPELVADFLQDPTVEITEDAIAAFCKLENTLGQTAAMCFQAHSLLILNFGCWKRTSVEAQHMLAGTALTLVSSDPKFFRECTDIGKVFRALHNYSREKSAARGYSADDVAVLRSVLCRIIENLYTEAGENITIEELRPMLNFLVYSKEEDLSDVLLIFLRILQRNLNKKIFELILYEGVNVFFRFVNMHDKRLRLAGIQMIGLFLIGCDRFAGAQLQPPSAQSLPADSTGGGGGGGSNASGAPGASGGSGGSGQESGGGAAAAATVASAEASGNGALIGETRAATMLLGRFPFGSLRELLGRFDFDFETYLYLVQLFAQGYQDDIRAPPKTFTKQVAHLRSTGGALSDEALGVIFDLTCNEVGRKDSVPFAEKMRIVNDISMAVEVSKTLQEAILGRKYWQRWFIRLLAQLYYFSDSGKAAETTTAAAAAGTEGAEGAESTESTENAKAREGLVRSIAVLLKAGLEGNKTATGWKHVEDFVLLASMSFAPGEAAKVSADVIGKLMDHIVYLVNTTVGTQSAALGALWGNFAHVVSIAEGVVFNAHGGEVYIANSLYYNAEGNWRDAMLVLKIFYVFDKLWACDAIRAAATSAGPAPLETIQGKKRPLYVAVARLVLAFFQEGRRLFQSSAFADERFQLQKAGISTDCAESYRRSCRRLEQLLRWMLGLVPSSSLTSLTSKSISAKDLGAFCIWVVHDVFRTLNLTSDIYDAINGELYDFVRRVASLARPHVEALIPLLRPDSADGGRSLYPYLFAGSPPLAEFVDKWFRPYFMDPVTDNPTVKQLQFYAGEFETKLFLTPAAAIIAKTEAAVVAVKEVLSKADTQDFDYKEAFSKELMTFEMTLTANASRAKARRAFLNVQMRRYLDKRLKALLRHAAAPYGCGCYDYQAARKMYPKLAGGSEKQQQDQDKDKDKPGSGSTGADADADSNLDPQLTKEPIWKVDTALCTGMHTRPLLKVDFREKCTPRKVKNSPGENANETANATTTTAAAAAESSEKGGEDGADKQDDELKDMLKVKMRKKNYETEDGWEVVGEGEDEDEEWEVVEKSGGGAESAEADGDVIDDVDIPEGELPAVGEKVLYIVKAVRIAMLDKIPGTLCITKTFLYFFREGDNDGSRGYKCWPLEALDRVFLRRFIVSNAIEIFTAGTRRGYLFEIPDMKDCTKFVRHLSSAVSDRSSASSSAVATSGAMLQQPQPQPQAQSGESRKLKAYISNPMRMFKKSGLTDLWVRRKISNFQYLMALNTYAGRTFNDLAQYPVFPWVLSDYSSRFIDTDDTGVYRDLSKPVGALNPSRLEGFKIRYEEMKMQLEDEQAAAEEEQRKRGGGGGGKKGGEASGIDVGSIPPFLYGSHYSTLGAVTFWLTRLEPFSHVARDLQGGEFDCADRLFSGMELAWHNCLVSPSDVKELVPEFFYLPDFLRNENKYWLGRLQTGGVVDDVVLPPWAAGSPELFVQFNLEALESPYVSAHLHEWIDLIFGFKQRGKAAEAADNVFYYLTYPESIDPRSVQGDSVEAVALRTQLTYFGQCPFQLFSAPHPARAPLPEQPPLAIPTGKEISPKVIAACPYIPYASFGAGDWIGCLTRDRQLHVLSNHSAKTRLMIGAKQTYILNFTLADPVCTTEAFPTFVFGTTPDRRGLIVAKAASSSGSVVQVALDQRLFVADDEITALAITPDGSAIAVGLSSGVIQLFEIKVITLTTSNSGAAAGGNSGAGGGAAAGANGGAGSGAGANMLSSSGGGGGAGSEVEGMVTSYPLVNVEAGPLATIKGAGQTARITRICFMADSPVLAAASEDDLVCVYHVRPGYFNLVSAIDVRGSSGAHVSSMEFVKSTSNLAILTGGTKSLSLYTLNGVLVETLELDSSSTKRLLVVNKREEGSEDYQLANDIFIVFDTEGATFITSKLYHLPAPRHRTRWILPKEILDMYEIVDAFIWGKQGGGHSLASIPALNYLIPSQGDQQGQQQQQQQMAQQQQKKSGLFGGKLSGLAKFGSSSSSSGGKSSLFSSDSSAAGFNSAAAAAAGGASSLSASSSTSSKSKKVKVVVVCRKRPMCTTTSTTIYLAFEV